MRHKITTAIAATPFTHQIAGSFGKSEHKSLEVIVSGLDVRYEVTSERKVICTTGDIEAAVEAYNEA
jgi:hypothetical protein